MDSARVRSEMAMVAAHCVRDHSSHARDRLSRSDCALLCKIARRLCHTRTGHAAFSESLALARRMDTLLGIRSVYRRVAGTAGSALWGQPFFAYSVFTVDISIWPRRSASLLVHSLCDNGTVVP